MDDQGEVVGVQDPVEPGQGGVQGELLELGVDCRLDGVGGVDLALEQLGLEAAQGGHPGYLTPGGERSEEDHGGGGGVGVRRGSVGEEEDGVWGRTRRLLEGGMKDNGQLQDDDKAADLQNVICFTPPGF